MLIKINKRDIKAIILAIRKSIDYNSTLRDAHTPSSKIHDSSDMKDIRKWCDKQNKKELRLLGILKSAIEKR
jgi:hypothetical protein